MNNLYLIKLSCRIMTTINKIKQTDYLLESLFLSNIRAIL